MLSQAANDYLTVRRGLGFKLVDTGELLTSFAAFATEHGDQVIRATTALEWAARGPSVFRRYRRLRTLSLFAEYLRAEDTRHEKIPMENFPSSIKPRRYPPRIFSAEEIERVLSLTARLRPDTSIRPLTYRTLIGLLFSTGMRIGEALNLRLADIQSDSLTIRETKFGKSRWLPGTVLQLWHYDAAVQIAMPLSSTCWHFQLTWVMSRSVRRIGIWNRLRK